MCRWRRRTCASRATDARILQLVADFKNDSNPKKVNLGVGAYRDDHGKPWVLPAVKGAIQELNDDPEWEHEYLTMTGLPDFLEASALLLFGKDSPALKEKRIVSN